ncbi:DUF7289 family protein [Natrialbaceae archaeon A-gly3]
MSLRGHSEGSGHRSSRAQSAVIGLVLLIGVVAAGSVAILTVGGTVIGETEQQAEQERIEQAFVELSHTMATTAADGDSVRTVEFDAGEKGAVAMTDAGRIHLWVGDENVTDENPIQMGAIEYKADDGSIVGYQAGGVWRETGEDTQMLSPPSVDYDHGTNTLTLPVTTVSDQQELTSGEVTVESSGLHDSGREVDNFVEGRVVTLEIKSEYYRGWEVFFEEEVDDVAVTVDPDKYDGDMGYLEVELGMEDLEGAFDSHVGVPDSDNVDRKGEGESNDIDVEEHESLPVLDEIIADLVNETNTSENREWADDEDEPLIIDGTEETFESGTYFANEVDIGDGEKAEFNLQDGNATLVVDGDIDVEGDFKVNSSSDNHLRIYTSGNVTIDSGEMCVKDCEPGNDDHMDAKLLQVYGTSEMLFTLVQGGNGYFEGIIYAPGGDANDFSDVEHQGGNQGEGEGNACDGKQICLFLASNYFDGAIVGTSIGAQSSGGDFTYDDNLKGFEPDIYPDGYIVDITYLNVAVHEVNVEN